MESTGEITRVEIEMRLAAIDEKLEHIQNSQEAVEQVVMMIVDALKSNPMLASLGLRL